MKYKAIKRIKIIYIRSDILKIENTTKIEKNKTKYWFLKKIEKIYKLQVLIKKN